MSVAVASFDAFPSRDLGAMKTGNAGLRLARRLLFAIAAVAATGTAIAGFTLAAGWMLSSSLQPKPSHHTPASSALRRIALAPPQPDPVTGPGPADIVVFPVFADSGEPAPVVRLAQQRARRIELPPPTPAALLSLRKAEKQQIAAVALSHPPSPMPAPRRKENPPPAVVAENRTAIYDISAR